MPSEPGPAAHVLEFPGGYTRSTGPVIGAFLTELRAGRLVGVRTAAGRVLVPPTEYDPDTGEPVTEEFVPVGPAGTVTTWAWVERPAPGQPLDRPFAWALIRLDGADTALLHAVDVGPGGTMRTMRTGLRVRPRWRAERVGSITDLACFEPEISMITTPSRVEYRLGPGRAVGEFLAGLAANTFVGARCGACGKVYVPYRTVCPADAAPMAERVELPGTGTVTTFAINNIPDPRAPQVPFVSASIVLDGADVAMFALVAGIPAEEVRMGMRVRVAWTTDAERAAGASPVRWFEPSGEPDAPFEAIRDFT